jgi:two-component system, NarL family, response regulator DevR
VERKAPKSGVDDPLRLCDSDGMEAVATIQRRKLLIVEDDPSLGRSLHRGTRGFFEPVIAGSVKQALEILDAGLDVAGAVVDIGLPDGTGFEVVAALRRLSEEVPVLVLTGSNDPAAINRAHALRAEYVCKPEFGDNLAQFVQRALSGKPPPPKDRVSATIAEIAAECRLSTRECEILKLAVDGIPRSHIAERMGVSENTVKTQVRSLLDKVGQEALSAAVWWVRSRAGE